MGFFLVNSYIIGNPYQTLLYVGGTSGAGGGSTSSASISLTSLTGGAASSPSTGDLVIVAHGFGGTADKAVSITTGYTEVAELFSSDSYANNFALAYKIMGGTPDTTVTVSGSQVTSEAYASAVHVWRNVDQTTPMDVTYTSSQTLNSLIVTPAAITPVTPGAIILAAGSGSHDPANGGSSYSTTNLSKKVQGDGIDTYKTTTVIAAYESWITGTYTPQAWTWNGTDSTSYSANSITIALRPALA